MLLNREQPAFIQLRCFFRSMRSVKQVVVGKLADLTIYIDKNVHRIRSNGELNKEVRAFPNTPSIFFERSAKWEVPKLPKNLRTLTFNHLGLEEIKDVRVDEFSHWTSNADFGRRKALEFENYNLVKQDCIDVFPARFSREQPKTHKFGGK